MSFAWPRFGEPTACWLRRAEYPELPGCFGEGLSPEEAMADLDRNRERMVRELLAAGAEIPVPRRPLERLMRKAHAE